jgi:hypothetical protein
MIPLGITYHGNGEMYRIDNCWFQGPANATGSWGLYAYNGSGGVVNGGIFQGFDQCMRFKGGGVTVIQPRLETNKTAMALGLDDSTAAGASDSLANFVLSGATGEANDVTIDAISLSGGKIFGCTFDASSNCPSGGGVYGIRLRNVGNVSIEDVTVATAGSTVFSQAAISIEGNPTNVVMENVSVVLANGGTGWKITADARFSPYFINCTGPGLTSSLGTFPTVAVTTGYWPRTFANAPQTPIAGMMVPFTDSSVTTLGSNISGGGSTYVLGFYNGSAWTVAAK